MCKPNPASPPMTSTASSSTKLQRFAALLWMLRSRHKMQCHLAAYLDTSGQLTVMTSSNSSYHYLIGIVRPIRCQSGYLKHVPTIFHPFCAGCSMRRYFQVYYPVLSSQRMLSRMHVYRHDVTQLDMYWLKTQLNSTQLNWTDLCSSARVLSSRDLVGIKCQSTIGINLYKQL